jgi:hypothetical protein
MLLFSTSPLTVDGITVFPDHEKKDQFWYLQGPVDLALLPDSDEPQFSLLEYAPDVAGTGVKGVGFLNVTLCLKPPKKTLNAIVEQIKAAFPDVDDPKLSAVPFDEGSVQIVALDLQGGGGTINTAREGTFVAVEHILGAVSPELFGDNNALFALTLTEDGATILKAAFEDGMAPIGGIYSLKFTGVRPALDVEITADLKRVYDSFSVGLEAKYAWASLGIDATFEKLRQDGAIKIKVVNLAGDQANTDKEQQALALFKDQILSQWFTPSLSPATAQTADAGTPTLPGSPTINPSHPNPSSPTPTNPTNPNSPTNPSHPNPSSPTGGGQNPGMGGPPQTNPRTPPTSPQAPPTGFQPPHPNPQAPAGGGVTPRMGELNMSNLGSAAQGAAQAASPYGLALKLKIVHQEELKTVTYNYSRMDAVQRTYAPQGLFGVMLSKVDKSKHYLQVDGTDAFFQKFSVAVTPPRDFAAIGLQTAHVALDYGDATGDGPNKHGEFVFDAAHNASTSWDLFKGQITSTEFSYAVDYTFDPQAGWTGEQDRYVFPATTTENRQLALDPNASLGFLGVTLTPGHIDSTVVDRVEVTLEYVGSNGWKATETFIVRSDSKPQTWKLRLSDKASREYTYTTRCVLKDDTAFATEPARNSASAIVVSDAFKGRIEITVVPAFDATKMRAALVEFSYQDQAASYRYANTLFLAPNNPQPTKVQIPVLDLSRCQYNYRITTITTNGEHFKGNLTTTDDPIVLVADRP